MATHERKPRRKLTRIDVLVGVALVAVFARLVYHVVFWRDIIEIVNGLAWWEWVIVAIAVGLFVRNAKGKPT